MSITPTLRIFADLCLFRQRTENVPTSNNLLLSTAVALVLFCVLSDSHLYNSSYSLPAKAFAYSLWAMLLGTVLLVILKSNGVAERWRQTATAIFGTLALTKLIRWPLASGVRQDKQYIEEMARELVAAINAGIVDYPTPAIQLSIAYYVTWAIVIWALCIQSSILRHAIEVPLWIAFTIVIGYSVVVFPVWIVILNILM